MYELYFTFYENRTSKWGTLKIKTWEEWILSLKSHSVRGLKADSQDLKSLNKEKDGPAVVLGVVPQDKTRHNQNVVEAHALALDLDSHPDSDIEALLNDLSEFEYFVYSTHKHGSKVVKYSRLRVIFPLKEPIPNAEFSKYWHAFDALTRHMNDPQTKNISRLHYLPSTFDITKALTHHNPGRWLSTEDLDPYIGQAQKKETSDIIIQSDLDSIRNRLNVMKNTDPLKPIARAILAGESFAPENERHKPILSITMWLARKNQNLTAEHLKELFESSVSEMPSKDDLHKELRDAYFGFVEKLKATAPQYSDDVYSKEELEYIAARQNCTVEDLKHRWIIQTGGGGWVLQKNGNYTPLQEKNDIVSTIKKHLDRAPIELYRTNPESGRRSFKQLSELVYEYGDVSFQNIADMRAQCSHFDAEEKTMIEAVCPIRADLKPKYDKDIDIFFQKFFGEYYEKGLDWLTGAVKLNEIICAVYFNGPKGSGKTMLIHGLAAIWSRTGTPTSLEEFLKSNFNESVRKCPVVLADEQMPKTFKGDSITAQLRSMLSITSRPLTRKHKSTSDIIGGIRLCLTSNNDSMLDTNEICTPDDFDAIAERFWYLKIRGIEAAEFLKSLPRSTLAYWWNGGIAQHILWLSENREIKNPGKRFIVEGGTTEMHQLLRTGTTINSLVCEWIVKWLESPIEWVDACKGLVRIHNQRLLVNVRVIVDHWSDYIKNKRYEPTVKNVGEALRSLSEKESKPVSNYGKTVRYRVVIPEALIAWSNRHGMGDPKLIMDRINEVDRREAGAVPLWDRQQEPQEENPFDVIGLKEKDKEGY